MNSRPTAYTSEFPNFSAPNSGAESESQVIIVGGGLAGMVAAYEAVRSGLRVTVVEQEGRQNLGAQAFYSLGGLFYVDSPEQRLMGVKDSEELAWRDWEKLGAVRRCRKRLLASPVGTGVRAFRSPGKA